MQFQLQPLDISSHVLNLRQFTYRQHHCRHRRVLTMYPSSLVFSPPVTIHDELSRHKPVSTDRQQGNLQRNANKVIRNFTPCQPLSEVYQKLLSTNLITRIQPQPLTSPLLKNHDPNSHCAYHMDISGHDSDNCQALKHNMQDLINSSATTITLQHRISLRIHCIHIIQQALLRDHPSSL